ncbi:hypothetical protein Tco_1033547, partial [Tanacetum coccineum]
VMSSAPSAVTYTSVYTNFEPGRVFWGADEEISDGGSPRVIVYGYDRLPMQPPQDPDYVPEPIYPEYIPLEDEHVFLVEEQPLPPVDSPIAESLGYVVESDPEEDPEEYEDDEIEDGPVDYPMDGGDDGDDDDGDSSRDDADDEDEDEEDEEEEEEDEEEEHLAPADSAVVVPTVVLVSPPEGTEPVIPPPSTDITTTGAAKVERLLCHAYSTAIIPVSLSHHLQGSGLLGDIPICTFITTTSAINNYIPHHLGVQPKSRQSGIAFTQAFIDAVTAEDDIPESERPPRKRSCLFALGFRYEVEESSSARPTGGRGIDYGFEMVHIVEEEAYASREAWAHAIGLSQAGTLIQTQHQVHETRSHMQQAEIAELRETDHRHQAQMIETLYVIRDIRREMGNMQAELLALREQRRRARQPAPDARVPDHQDASRDADSHI